MVHFLTFGSYNYTKQVERIKNEALASGFFQGITAAYPADLHPGFRNANKTFLHGRGYGYWIWKPQIILQTLDRLAEGEVLVYADSGCTINRHGAKRFAEYMQMVRDHPSGIVTFQLPEHLEVQYTKREVFERLGYEHAQTPQVCATYIIVRRCIASIALLQTWSALTREHKLINDEKFLPQDPRFIDHRHDQSIWSILNKRAGTCIVGTDEGWPPGRLDYPIWGSRIRLTDDSKFTHLIQ
jgi:hypothetical protein